MSTQHFVIAIIVAYFASCMATSTTEEPLTMLWERTNSCRIDSPAAVLQMSDEEINHLQAIGHEFVTKLANCVRDVKKLEGKSSDLDECTVQETKRFQRKVRDAFGCDY